MFLKSLKPRVGTCSVKLNSVIIYHMSRYNIPEDFDRAAFEAQYYTELASDDVVSGAITLRNDGWDLFKSGSTDEGVGMLVESRNILIDHVGRPTELYGQLDEPEQLRKFFVRESYATIARLAQALCAMGEFDDALFNAKLAERHRPYSLIQDIRLSTGSIGLWAYYDQYEAIFSGRQGLVLSTSPSFDDSIHGGSEVSKRARSLARVSEDPRHVLFANNEMTQSQRDDTVRNFVRIARAATVANHVPLVIAKPLAKKVCAW